MIQRIKNFFARLPEQPYATRLQVLWIAVGAVSFVLLVIFGYSVRLQFKKTETSAESSRGIFATFGEAAKKFGQQLPEFLRNPTSSLPSFSSQSIQLLEQGFKENEFVARFSVENTSVSRILVVQSSDTNVVFVQGGVSYEPSGVFTEDGKIFPKKILSNIKLAGILTFRNLPTVSGGKVIFRNLHFDDAPSSTWDEEFPVKTENQKTEVLPRY